MGQQYPNHIQIWGFYVSVVTLSWGIYVPFISLTRVFCLSKFPEMGFYAPAFTLTWVFLHPSIYPDMGYLFPSNKADKGFLWPNNYTDMGFLCPRNYSNMVFLCIQVVFMQNVFLLSGQWHSSSFQQTEERLDRSNPSKAMPM